MVSSLPSSSRFRTPRPCAAPATLPCWGLTQIFRQTFEEGKIRVVHTNGGNGGLIRPGNPKNGRVVQPDFFEEHFLWWVPG